MQEVEPAIEDCVKIDGDMDLTYRVAHTELSRIVTESKLPFRRHFAASRLRKLIWLDYNDVDDTAPWYIHGYSPQTATELAPRIIEHQAEGRE
jgi:hypothetical protein